MKFSVIREFLRLAENKNYSKTADQLYIAQPTLSRHIASLEDELGVQLISRSTSSFELTPAGRAAEAEFRVILERYQILQDKLARLNSDAEGELHLGVLYYDMDAYVYKIVDAFRSRFPKVKLVLHSYQPLKLEEALERDQIDVGLTYNVTTYSDSEKNIEFLPFLKLNYSIHVAVDDPLAEREEAFVEDLAGRTIILPQMMKINQMVQRVESILEENGVEAANRYYCENFDEMPLVFRKPGQIAVSAIASDNSWGGRIKKIPFETLRYTTDASAVWKKSNPNPMILLLSSTIRSCFP